MAKELEVKNDALPAHLQGQQKVRFADDINSGDIIVPRVKLLQATSPEVTANDAAKIGESWHTTAEQSMGKSLRFAPLILKKSVVLWAPRGDDRGILARSSDCVHWDKGFENLEFEVKLKGHPAPIKYFTDENVAKSGLADFGSAIPGDTKSRPAASLTYMMMFYFPDFPVEFSPAIVINTRSSIRAAKGLISKTEMRPVSVYDQMYLMGTTDEVGDEGPYKGYSYTADGYTTAEQHVITEALWKKYTDIDWKANEETDADSSSEGATGRAKATGNVNDKSAF